MLLGHWKNIQDLEENLCLDELELIVTAARDKEHREQRFLAAMKGVDLDANAEDSKERFERAKRNAEAKLKNKTEADLEREDLAALGIQVKE